MTHLKEEGICLQCNSAFEFYKSAQSGKFCSYQCYWDSMVGVSHNHKTRNGKPAWNKGMKLPERSGENHPNWQGDKYSENYRERRKVQKLINKKVFERDGYTCQKCGKISGYLHVHHIEGFSENKEKRFDIDNCKTLCVKCHYFVTFNRYMPEGIVWGQTLNKRMEV